METSQRKFSSLQACTASGLVTLALLVGKIMWLAQGSVFPYRSSLNSATFISNGLFMVAIDFGNQFTNGGDFLKLDPQPPLSLMPYAITARNSIR